MTDNRIRTYDTARAVRNRARARALERLKDAHPEEFELYHQEELASARAEIAAIEKTAKRKPAARSTTAHHAAPLVMPDVERHRTPATAEIPQPQAPAVLLQRGPRAGKTLEQRLRTDVGTCTACITAHDRGHRCPICGTAPEFGKAKAYRYRGHAPDPAA